MSEPKSERDLFESEFVETFDSQFRPTGPDHQIALVAWVQRAEIARKDLAAKDAVIAELVGLLEHGDALYAAGRASVGNAFHGDMDSSKIERESAFEILADYNAAITEHGSKE